MAILPNPRHERFAQELAKGKSASQSYRLAGYARNDGNAIRLKGNERVQARVAELQQRVAEKVEITVESLVDELEEARELAKRVNQPAAMSQATFNKARLLGLVVDKKEDVTPRRTLSDIDAAIERLAKASAGAEGGASGASGGAGAGTGDDEAFPTVPGHGTA